MKSYAFLFWAYNLIWFGIAGYVLFVFNRMRRMERKLDETTKRLERGEA